LRCMPCRPRVDLLSAASAAAKAAADREDGVCAEGGATMRTIRSLAHGDALVALEAVTVALKAADEAA
jgi:hypothetical protein